MKTVKVNLDVLEMMVYFWQSVSEKEKVSEEYLIDIGNKEAMRYLYNEEFNSESVRKVLSAISNRELLNNSTKLERKFWNNNMWILEDLENMNNMVQPVKTLNIDKLKEKNYDNGIEDLEVIFIPGHEEEYYIDGNKLIINFFRVMVDFMDSSKVNICGKPILEYIEEKIGEMKK